MQDNWVKQISSIEFALNNTQSTATGLTPFKVETGRDPLVPLDLSKTLGHDTDKSRLHGNIGSAYKMIENITALQQQARDNIEIANSNMSKHADARRRKAEELSVGDRVYLKLEGIDLDIFKKRPCKKLNPLWYGPLEILKKVSPVSYKLSLPTKSKIHDVFHVDRLRGLFLETVVMSTSVLTQIGFFPGSLGLPSTHFITFKIFIIHTP